LTLQSTSLGLNQILDEILPPFEDLQEPPLSRGSQNSVYHLNIVIYGKARRGKTELANSIVAHISQLYCRSRVHVAYEITDLAAALGRGWEPGRLIQVLVVDDLTLAEHSMETYQKYFRIGHIMEEKTGQRNGLVVTILIVHRFFSLPKELRADIDLLAVKSVSTNPSDANLLRAFLGDDLVAELSSLARRRDVLAYYISPTLRGISFFQLAETNYFESTKTVSASETLRLSLPPSDIRIIQDIASGRDTIHSLLEEIGWSKPALESEVKRMVTNGYVTLEGFRRRLRITPKAYDKVGNNRNQLHFGRSKERPNANKFDVSWGMSFRVVFGALLGLFFGWLLISGLAALIYWAAYTYLLQRYVPAILLPWIPFRNPTIDFALGVLSGTWFFLKINPAGIFTSLGKR